MPGLTRHSKSTQSRTAGIRGQTPLIAQYSSAIALFRRSFAIIPDTSDYIRMNPVKEGFVDEPHDYRYSSAKAYAGLSALL
jgi:hypothetical protein